MPSACVAGAEVAARPGAAGDGLFWQYPCRTEESAYQRHRLLLPSAASAAVQHVYLGFPWATQIDMSIKRAWTAEGRAAADAALQRIGRRVAHMRRELAARGLSLRVHTVCQHVQWADAVGLWEPLGVTDAWLSHCPASASPGPGSPIRLHAWPLYAVNVEDPARRAGLTIGTPVDRRSVLASFFGAHLPHYVDDTRLRLKALAGVPGFVVRITDEWHFEQVVYRQQIAGKPAAEAGADDAVEAYNRLLGDSVFALCPGGAGHNTLRLWEALAVGAIPVLFGPGPRLPDEGPTATGLDWDRIVLRFAPERMAELPGLLAAVPEAERRERQRLGLQAYARIKGMRCFEAAEATPPAPKPAPAVVRAPAGCPPAGFVEGPRPFSLRPRDAAAARPPDGVDELPAPQSTPLARVLREDLGIDQVYVVNLRRRPDRLARVLREMSAHAIAVTRIEAVDAATAPEAARLHLGFKERPLHPRLPSSAHVPDETMRRYRETLSRGVFGYLLSQSRVLEDARRSGHRRILVLDDDVFFASDAAARLREAAASLPADWRIVHLGASEYADRAGPGFAAARVAGAAHLYHPIPGETCGSFAVAYDCAVFDDLQRAIDEADGTFDNVVLGGLYLRQRARCFVIDPAVCIPDVSDSDIRDSERTQQEHSARMHWEYRRYAAFTSPMTVAIVVNDFAALRFVGELHARMPGRIHLNLYFHSADGLRPVVPGRTFAPRDAEPLRVEASDGATLRELAQRLRIPAADAVLLWPGPRALDDEAVLQLLVRMLAVANRTARREGWIDDVAYCLAAGVRHTAGLHSIVIPCFRSAGQAWPAIASALAQDVGAHEVIVVNDNPDDPAFRPELLRRLEAHFATAGGGHRPEVMVLDHLVNRNASAARNTGFLASCGEYLSFLDDDDHFEPDRLRTVGEVLAAAPAHVGACYCGYTGTWNGERSDDRFPTGDLGPLVLGLRYAEHYMCTNTVTFRRSAFARLGGFNESYRRHQDLELMTRFFNEYEITAAKAFCVRNRPNPVTETFVADIDGLCRLKQRFLRDFRREILAGGTAFVDEVLAAHVRDVTKRDRALPPAAARVIQTLLRSVVTE